MDKLQELTQKLYDEGLAKGREEGAALVAQARSQAEDILHQARKEADAIVAQAQAEADDLRSKITGDLRMAAEQSVQATRHDIENLVLLKVAGEPAAEALSSPDFVREIIRTVAARFDTDGAQDLSVILPERFKGTGLDSLLATAVSAQLGKGLEASFSRKLSGGFRIGPKNGGYFVSFTDETFKELISDYLRPATRKLQFGE